MEAGAEGHWAAVRGRRRALANVALNIPVASGKGSIRKGKRTNRKRNVFKSRFLSIVAEWCQVMTWKTNKLLQTGKCSADPLFFGCVVGETVHYRCWVYVLEMFGVWRNRGCGGSFHPGAPMTAGEAWGLGWRGGDGEASDSQV